MLNVIRMYFYLMFRYKIRPRFTAWHKGQEAAARIWTEDERGFYGAVTNITALNKAQIFVRLYDNDSIPISFLHEVGHVAAVKRSINRRKPELLHSTLYSEIRASVYAVRVAKLFGLDSKKAKKLVDVWYGTYVAHIFKDKPLSLADESYKGVKTFGVKYD